MRKKVISFIIFSLLLLMPLMSKTLLNKNETIGQMVSREPQPKLMAVFELDKEIFAFHLVGFTGTVITNGESSFAPLIDFELQPQKTGNQKVATKYVTPNDSLYLSYIFRGKGSFSVSLQGADLKNTATPGAEGVFKTTTTIKKSETESVVTARKPKDSQGRYSYDNVKIMQSDPATNPYGSYAVSIVAEYVNEKKPKETPRDAIYAGEFRIFISAS